MCVTTASRIDSPEDIINDLATPLQGIHVLLIDDDDTTLEELRSELKRGGAMVTAVRAAQAPRAAVSADIIICDVASVDAAGGAEFVARLAGLHAHGGRHVPTVGIGRSADSRTSGFDRRLAKPVSGDELWAVVMELVQF